ncbi:TAXI family TRAP transporter solute-binding subunit [Actinomadura nitritigenes]|uniref:TAXI family TRAP transporter solute-binding subunit n=1 Tax=Actinomadura nitritigenes TaxID=134602 RepID=UPI0027DE5429|nr:TAXI family TRAP transporter solute-binding subunit [Actinomadura nitritigenes]
MRWVMAVVAVVLLSTVSGCGGGPARPWRLVIAAGGRKAVYYAYGQGIARAAAAHLPGARPQVLATAASLENLRLVSTGRADVAFTLADSAELAFEGRPPFTRQEPVVALARLYENYTYLVVAADSAIRRLTDLRGKRVSLGADGSGTELIATRLLTVARLDPAKDVRASRTQLVDAAAALRAGRLDAFFFSGGLPIPQIVELAKQMPIRIVGLADYAAPLRRKYRAFYEEQSILASTYGLDAPVQTIGVPNYLVVNASMPDDRAYALTRLLFTRRDDLAAAHPAALYLDRRSAVSTYPLPLHPGAIRYYRETKGEG